MPAILPRRLLCRDRIIFVDQSVLDHLGLRDCQHVDEAMVWRAVDLNSAAMRAKVEANGNTTPEFERAVDEIEALVSAHYGKKA